ncbi:AMP-binding protein [Actinosynnema sp. NPDC020468]|uniref:AMP-binding protein n=1 Tax=Actinosynnema sp. NPDC020468 TaxID=3154488 RepID=UPI0033C1B974
MPVAERVLTWSRLRPGTTAFRVGGFRLGYADLAARAAAVATGLRALAGDRPLLAIDVGNSPTFAELVVGGTAGDGVCAVLDPAWPAARTREVLRLLRPDLVVTTRPVAVDAPVLTVGEDGSYAGWLAGQEADPARDLVAGDPGSTFLIGFTSGTSGVPKAFSRTRGTWRASLAHAGDVFGLAAGDHTLAPGPLSHGLGLYALVEALHEGTTFATLPRFDAAATRAELGAVTRLVVVPTMLRGLNRELDADPAAYPGVTGVVSSGAKLDPATVARTRAHLPHAHVHEYYGASELSFVTVRHTPPDALPDDDPDAVGTPFPGVEIEIRDDAGRPVPAGVPGAVHVRGPLVSSGYVWGDDGTAFRTDGEWATVGDHGLLDEAGELHLVGRAGAMVITGGHNVYPSEVETALRRLDGVDEAVVVGLPDEYLGTVLVAVVSGPGARALSTADVRRGCADHLPRHKIPRRVFVVRDWPLTPSGKIVRARVEEWLAAGDGRLVALPA